jgi:type I restriction enzyme S subunit
MQGDVLLNITGASIGRSAVADQSIEGGNVNQHVCIIRPMANKLNPYFLNQFLLSDGGQIQVDSFQAGGNRQGLNFAQIKSFTIPCPPILDEQQKIADCLASVDALISAQRKKVEELKTYKNGLMQQLFLREGETIPHLRFIAFRGAGSWENSTLGNIATITSGGTPSRSKQEYWDGNIPWVTTSLIDFGLIQNANEFISAVGLKESSAKIFPKNTILMAMYGQGITRGKVAVLGIDAATNQACAAILLKKGLNAGFVFQNLAGRYAEIRDLSNQGGQENLSGGLIEKISFSYPSSNVEQQKIADCLTNIDALITAQTQKLEALKTHKKGLMQALFPAPDEVEA